MIAVFYFCSLRIIYVSLLINSSEIDPRKVNRITNGELEIYAIIISLPEF